MSTIKAAILGAAGLGALAFAPAQAAAQGFGWDGPHEWHEGWHEGWRDHGWRHHAWGHGFHGAGAVYGFEEPAYAPERVVVRERIVEPRPVVERIIERQPVVERVIERQPVVERVVVHKPVVRRVVVRQPVVERVVERRPATVVREVTRVRTTQPAVAYRTIVRKD